MLTLYTILRDPPLDKASITPEHKFAKTGCSSATISTPSFGTAAYAGIALVGTTVTMTATTSIIGAMWLLRAISSLSALAPSTGSSAYPANAPRLQGRRKEVDEVAYCACSRKPQW